MLYRGCVRDWLEVWVKDYSLYRPHSSLGELTPQEFAQKIKLDKLTALLHKFNPKDAPSSGGDLARGAVNSIKLAEPSKRVTRQVYC